MNILAVVAHPDDEVLMCGGTLARYAGEGHTVRVLVLAQGIESRKQKNPQQEIAALREAARETASVLGVRTVEFCSWSDQEMNTVSALDLARTVEKEGIWKYEPAEIVITHGPADCNLDHNATFRAVQAATRPRPNFCVQEVWVGECPSSTEWGFGNPAFQPNTFVDITAWLSVKLEALNLYGSELRPWPHPRSIKGVRTLAAWRGASVGYNAAEAFNCLWRKE